MKFLHQLADVKELFEVVARERGIIPLIVEKDYWLMHLLWGLKNQGFTFALKGGTSLSKGFGIIDRFSEDVDIQIEPDPSKKIRIGKNHDKEIHKAERLGFFNNLADEIKVSELQLERDESFDDADMRNAGIRAFYHTHFKSIKEIKDGVLLEAGFDQIAPNEPRVITSWAYEKAKLLEIEILDNRAHNVNCYYPEYTFVEKLQTISKKFRNQQKNGTLPINFLRHYYDIYQLLNHERIQDFIGTPDYFKHKNKRFKAQDEKDLTKNLAFILSNEDTFTLYSSEYEGKSNLYFGKQPQFREILDRIKLYIDRL
jgi:predicted nucleotidyltransferase component of viral defense system